MIPYLKHIIGNLKSFPKFEFHISKEIRKKYEIDDELFSITGNVIFHNNIAVRNFVKRINDKRLFNDHVKVGEVNAAGLLDEIYHFLFRIYEVQVNPGVIKKALSHLNASLGEENVRKLLFDFIEVFPPLEVYKGQSSAFDYLNSFTADRSNMEITLEEMILLSFANINPANKNILELFDQNYLSEKETYKKTLEHLELFFQDEKKFGPDNQDFFTFLKTPILTNPDNIEAQLDFIREKWGVLLGDKLLNRILTGKDLIKEDIILGFGGGGGAPVFAPQYKEGMGNTDFLTLGKSGYRYALDAWKDYEENENFTKDIDWMPRVVMIAKNSYVWLDQLSKKYNRYIKTLDQIPDEELDLLAKWGFNGLWLIGIWERSSASKKIKHILGNIDAVASAYSLYDYQIAWDLGGEDAYNNLNERAHKRGIRLASDMVPNHTGIFSKWVIEKPDYFIQSHYPPFPNYRFSGPDLSDDPTVSIRIEDGYWSRSDAAVVFQRVDNRTGEARYIYHGNDGTNMPWNDTAQLNLIRADVREAVIQKIFEVARKFSIIRFDAAMTLAKKHFSRLWYPVPGRGGDIPTRSDYSMTQEEFDKLFPQEFWREVVDRINSEMPETLLLAEAFWLMEGYFVRTLGMHRVYNSAFMHMMMKEENSKYRDLISNTLEFEPEILKRYVNFMSNPDEETAIKQFGTDDKYFGVCILMVTLPGLPMFAHGQIEGYTEKYGMEYQRAYYSEVPNQWLIDRHKSEIFPLMKRRYLFSQVTNFWLFDFIDNYGNINENVFAYVNSERGENSLVFYNNKYQTSSGKIFRSSPKLVNYLDGKKELQTRTLSEALGINPTLQHYYIFREHISNLEYLKSGHELAFEGFYLELGGFKYSVYLNFREVYDANGDYEKLARKLKGKGVPSIERAFEEMKFELVHKAFEDLFDDESIENFIQSSVLLKKESADDNSTSLLVKKFGKFLNTVKKHYDLKIETKKILNQLKVEIAGVEKLNGMLEVEIPVKTNANNQLHHILVLSKDNNYKENSILFLLWLTISQMKNLFETESNINKSNYFEKLLLDTPVKNILMKLGKGEFEIFRVFLLLNILVHYEDKIKIDFEKADQLKTVNSEYLPIEKDRVQLVTLKEILNDNDVKLFIGVNEYDGKTFYSKENFEELLNWIITFYCLEIMKNENYNSEIIMKMIDQSFGEYIKIMEFSNRSEYKYEQLKEKLDDNKY
jgi:glycosidase